MVMVLLSMTGKVLEPPLRLPPPVHLRGSLMVEEAVEAAPGRFNTPERVTASLIVPLIVQGSPALASNVPSISTAPLSVAGPYTPRRLLIESDEGSSKRRLLQKLGALTV
jgi:hypothetical protein